MSARSGFAPRKKLDAFGGSAVNSREFSKALRHSAMLGHREKRCKEDSLPAGR